jgi:O-antigen/teichoic acid export membrane protein
MTDRQSNLLAFQWSVYPEAHQSRRNLWIHLLSVPLFMLGTLLLVSSPWSGAWAALAGMLAMAGAMALQGLGHRGEATPPPPFRGALDIALRIFAEQWITWPRFVLSGGFSRALREASSTQRTPAA